MSLGEAFITVRADTTLFDADLERIRRSIEATQATISVRPSTTAAVAAAGNTTENTVNESVTGADAVIATQEAIAVASKASTDSQIADLERLTRAREAAAAAAAALGGVGSDNRTGSPLSTPSPSDDASRAISEERRIQDAEQIASQRARLALDAQEAAANRVILAERVADARAADAARVESARAAAAAIRQTVEEEANREAAIEAARVEAARAASAAIRETVEEEARAERAADAARVASALAASAAIRAAVEEEARVERIEADAYAENERRRVAAALAAAAAIKAIEDRRNRENDAALAALIVRTRELAAAEAEARAEDARRTRALDDSAAAYRRVRASIDDSSNSTNGFTNKLGALSDALSKVGLTGQARMIALGVSIGFPVAVLGAFVAAAAAAGTAITIFALKAGDDLRSARLNFIAAGASVKDAADQVRAIQALSSKGLTFANLNADVDKLTELGVKAKDAVPILQALADAFAKSGDVGAKLQVDVDAATAAISTLAETAVVTQKNFGVAVKNTLLGVSAKDVFTELRTELGLTSKQLDDLLAKSKVTGAEVATAAVRVAQRGSQGALQNAVNESPTQAVTALKDSLSSALGSAFADASPAVAQAIDSISSKLNDVVTRFAPAITKDLPKIISSFSDAIIPFGDALIKSFALVEPTLTAIGKLVRSLSDDILGFFSQANKPGSDTAKVLGNLKDILVGFGAALLALKPVVQVIFTLLRDALAFLGPAFKAAGATLVVISDALSPIADLINKIFGSELVEKILKFAGTIAGVVAGVLLFTNAIGALGAAFAILSGPVGIIIAIGAALVYAYEKSKTFRDIVLGTFHAIVIGVGEAVKFIIDVIQQFVDFQLGVFETILKALAHLPKWLGGGVASDAAGAVQDLINGVDAVAAKVRGLVQAAEDAGSAIGDINDITVDVNISPAQAKLNALLNDANATASQIAAALDAVNFSPGGNNFTGPISPTGRQASAERDLLAAQAAAAKPIKIPGTGVNTGAGDSAAKAAKSAADTLKAAAETFKTALGNFSESIGGATTVDQINQAFKTLQSAINAEDKALKQTEPAGLKALVAKQKALLDQMAKQYADAAAQITAGDAAVASTLAAAISTGSLTNIAASIAALQQNATDLSHLTIVLPGDSLLRVGAAASATQDLQKALDARLKALQDFQANVQKVIDEGLNAGSVQDLINGGVDANGALAANLAGATPAAIAALNATQAQITAVAKKLAANAGDAAATAGKDAGKAVADGILQGLKDQNVALKKAMTDLADALVEQIKKDLHIKSPSQRMRDVGRQSGMGLVEGLGHHLRDVAAKAGLLAEAAMPKLGDVALDKLGSSAGQRQLAIALTGPASAEFKADARHAELLAGLDRYSRSGVEIHAPITQHVAGVADADTHGAALASRLARIGGALR